MYHKKIEIPCSPFIELPPVPDYTPSYFYKRILVRSLKPEFLVWLSSKSLSVFNLNAILFYAHPNSGTSIHIDNVVENGWAINVVMGEAEIPMRWYKTHSEGQLRDADLNYNKIDPATSELIDSCVLSSHLVRIDIPHESNNTSDKGAWVLSIRQHPMKMDWDEVRARF